MLSWESAVLPSWKTKMLPQSVETTATRDDTGTATPSTSMLELDTTAVNILSR